MGWFNIIAGALSLAREIIKYARESNACQQDLDELTKAFQTGDKATIKAALDKINE